MPWKCRKNHLYFYSTRREGGRVVQRYLGRGVLGQTAAELIRLEAEAKGARALIERDERDLDAWHREVNNLLGEFLTVLGYHKHKGTWRRKRMSKNELSPADRARVVALAKQAQEGSAKAGRQLAELLAGDPERLIRLGVGDVEAIAEDQAVREMTRRKGGPLDELFSEAIRARLAKMRGELTGADPGPIETLLVDRIAISWLRCQMAEIQVSKLATQEGGYTPAAMEFRTRILDRAHRRLLSALKALAQVRRLGVPRVQVNLGDKQVNIMS
jgi:hypothetical protein